MLYLEKTPTDLDNFPIALFTNFMKLFPISASSEAVGFPVQNVIDDNTFDFWQPTSSPSNLTVTRDQNFLVTHACLAAHNLGSEGITVSLEYELTPGSGWIPLAEITPTDNSTIIIAVTGTSARGFRFYFSGGIPSVGVAYMGSGIVFDTGILPGYVPLYMSQEVELLTSKSLSGQFIGNRIHKKSATNSFQLNILDKSFVQGELFQNFLTRYTNGDPFFFASNPIGIPDDAVYCWRPDGAYMRPALTDGGLFYNIEMSLEAYVGV